MEDHNKQNLEGKSINENEINNTAPQKTKANLNLFVIFGAILASIVVVIIAVIVLMGNNNVSNGNSSNNNGANNTPSTTHTHNFGIWETEKEATCTTQGVQVRYCSCGEKQSKDISATGKHNYSSKITTEATCVREGIKTFSCSNCNSSYTESIGMLSTHTYSSGKCVYCNTYDIDNVSIAIIYDLYNSADDSYEVYAFFYDSQTNLIAVDFTATMYIYDYTGENVIYTQAFTKRESDFTLHQSQFSGEMLGCKLSIKRNAIPESISPYGFFVTDINYQNGGQFDSYGEISNLPFNSESINFALEMPNTPLETTNAGVSGGTIKTETFKITDLNYEIICLNSDSTYSVVVTCSGEKISGTAPAYLMGIICLKITDSNGNVYSESIPITYSSNNKFENQSITINLDITKTYTLTIEEYNFWA